MKKVDMTNVQEAGDFTKLPAGAYICAIRNIEDVEEKEYLKVTYDICEGEFTGHFDAIRKAHPDWSWAGVYVKSYKTTALPMFKRFCSAISKSNGSFVFDGNTVNADEKTLIGKKLGIVLREEEYYSNSGDLRTRLIVSKEFPVSELDKQKVPDVKRLEGSIQTKSSAKDPDPGKFLDIPDGVEEELPFS